MASEIKGGKFHKKQLSNKNLDEEDNLEEPDDIPKKWFEQLQEDPKGVEPVTEQCLIELKDEAKKCHDSEVAHYNIQNSKSNSDFRWMKTVMSKGTVSDKIAAHTVAIQSNPVVNLETLNNLVGMVKVGKKKECTNAIEVLTELFLSDLLRPDAKLKTFDQRPLGLLDKLSSGNAILRRKLLSTWYFEDQLKEVYANYVKSLNQIAHDIIDNNKEKAIASMYKLLIGNPEQEKNLLCYIINKLGDPSQKVASKAIYGLGQLLIKHPNMQGVVLNEIEKLLFRSNISTKAQYYSICFLSQFYLSHEDCEVARKLIEVYFAFFKSCIKKGEVDSRMMSALLMGVNRAYPYAKLEQAKMTQHIDTMYRVVHIATFNISLHALTLLYQVSDFSDNISERFYCALYKKLLDPNLLTTTHQAILLNLIYKALLKDPNNLRVQAFIKRLLQLALYMQSSFACGVLYLVSQLIGRKEKIQSLILEPLPDDDDEEKYVDIKDEEEIERVQENNSDDDIKPDLDEMNSALAGPSWYHRDNKSKKLTNPLRYNPLNRNPLYAGANFSAYTELIMLKNHFHPTISLFANNILEGQIIKYTGDPLKDFSLIRFLERFVFKNPKKNNELPTQGIHPTFGKRRLYKPIGLKSLPVNSENYLNNDLSNIPVDEVFMYNFLKTKRHEKVRDNDDDDDGNDSDLESVLSEEFEEMLDKMTSSKVDDNLDYMNDLEKSKNKRNKGKTEIDNDTNQDNQSDEENEEFDDEDFGSDISEMSENEDNEDDQDSDKLSLEDDDEDDDAEDLVFADDYQSKNKVDINSLFASAEEFSSLLEDEGHSKTAPGGHNAYINKDKADVKQLDWESKRNRWLNTFDTTMGKKRHGKKRVNKGKPNHSSKKLKH